MKTPQKSQTALHCPHQSTLSISEAHQKWVTFEDLVDDAMEGGKLSPMPMRSGALREAIRRPRRLSMAENGTFCTETTGLKSSSISSSASSCDSDTNLHRQPILLNKPCTKFINKRKSFIDTAKLIS
jgi:hypothetical protein